MKKTCILSNHIYPFHVGGSEMVIKNVTENLFEKGIVVDIFGWDVPRDDVVNNIKINKMSIERIRSILSTYDNIIVYSDAFINLIHLLKMNSMFNKKIIIFPVGFTGIKSSSALKEMVIKNIDKLHFVCHDSSYVDAKFLNENSITYDIIPNGVCQKEFKFTNKLLSSNLRKKIVCVANTFPKKGHAELLQVCDLLSKELELELEVFCHTPSWDVGKRLQNQLLQFCKSKNYKVSFQIDKSRSDIIKGLESSDLFLFCSLKEVAPLCIIESAAAGLPWISFNVGNVSQVKGGLVNESCQYDQGGYVIPSPSLIESHAKLAVNILSNEDKYSQMSFDGVCFAKQFTWQVIVEKYASIIQN